MRTAGDVTRCSQEAMANNEPDQALDNEKVFDSSRGREFSEEQGGTVVKVR